MRRQIVWQREDIKCLQRAGISTKSAVELLERMAAKAAGLRAAPWLGGRARRTLWMTVYRRILRGADETHRCWVALEESKCIGRHFHALWNFCNERGLRQGPALVAVEQGLLRRPRGTMPGRERF
jgi:hypothetical protein